MERLAELIGKLNEQFAQNADPSQLLIVTQMIEAELLRRQIPAAMPGRSARVAVVMPAARQQPLEYNAYMPPPAAEITAVEEPEKIQVPANGQAAPAPAFSYDPLTEIPTLAHQPGSRELNEAMRREEFSLNDKLKEPVVEVAHKLNETPVRDLRKAIGINDRFVFVTELFRGDEVMYERSIKTINGFRQFAEAEYWIERELKIKLGWDDSKDCTAHFYRLVRRRFS